MTTPDGQATPDRGQCSHCIFWKRRWYERGTCHVAVRDLGEPTHEADGCEAFQPQVIRLGTLEGESRWRSTSAQN